RRLGISLAAELDPDRLAQLVVNEALSLTAAEFGAIFSSGRVLASSGLQPPPAPRIAALCPAHAALRVEDLAREPQFAPLNAAGSLLWVPIVSRTGGSLGGLLLLHARPAQFSDQHQRLLLGLAAQASIALDNARLLRSLQ